MSKLHFTLGFIAQVFYLAISAYSQPTFVHRSGSNHSDFGLSCHPTFDGGSILAQESSTNGLDLHSGLVKNDASGNMQWYKLYQIGDYTIPYTVLEAKDEGYVVLVSASDSSYVNNNRHFISLYKTDIFGSTQWNKQYSLSNNDLPLNLVYRKAGGYLSFSIGDYNLGNYHKTIVTRFDDNGNLIWSRMYSAAYGLNGVKGIEMPDNNICFIANAGDPSNNFFLNAIVTMLDSAGNILWSKEFGTQYDDEPLAIAANSANEIFITGRNYFLNRNWDSFLMRIDRFGNLISSRVYDAGTSGGEVMRCILTFNDGTCKLLGDMGSFNERDITMINIDSSLSLLSAFRYKFSPLFTNYPYDFYRAADGGLVFTGDYRPPTALRDAILVKTESDGTLPCFMYLPGFAEYNEVFQDTTFNITSQAVTVSPLNFGTRIPVNPFYDHVVCALTANTDQLTDAIIDNIFPNPVSDYLTVQLKNTEPGLVELDDIEGKVMYKEKIVRQSTCKIDMQDYRKGVYILKCFSDNKTQVIKIIKL